MSIIDVYYYVTVKPVLPVHGDERPTCKDGLHCDYTGVVILIKPVMRGRHLSYQFTLPS